MSGPLEGLRVLEYCGQLGQLAGKLLADMGADVVTVEPPSGTEARAVGPFVDDVPGPNRSLNYWYHNTNKRSVIADLQTSEGASTWRSLVGCADIVIEDGAYFKGSIDIIKQEVKPQPAPAPRPQPVAATAAASAGSPQAELKR